MAIVNTAEEKAVAGGKGLYIGLFCVTDGPGQTRIRNTGERKDTKVTECISCNDKRRSVCSAFLFYERDDVGIVPYAGVPTYLSGA